MAIPTVPMPTGGHILGQPFTITGFVVPVNVALNCNCTVAAGGDPSPLTIVASAPVACPQCRKVYHVSLNPANGQLQVAIGTPEDKES